jgi:hypothetical protein
MLAAGTAPADRERARELARSVAAAASELGMRDAERRARDLEARHDDATALKDASARTQPVIRMKRTGESWRIECDGVAFHLKDVKGVRLLAVLVANPGREYHVLDLDGRTRRHKGAVDRGDAGEVLDTEARRQYRARIDALRGELEEAEEWNDPGRAQKAREELVLLERELSRAVGLGGRGRRAGTAAERARINVQRRIRDAIRRIEAHHPDLARTLERSVKTGSYCSYNP